MFGNHTSDKGLASRKCEELLKLSGKNRVFGTQVERALRRGRWQVSCDQMPNIRQRGIRVHRAQQPAFKTEPQRQH